MDDRFHRDHVQRLLDEEESATGVEVGRPDGVLGRRVLGQLALEEHVGVVPQTADDVVRRQAVGREEAVTDADLVGRRCHPPGIVRHPVEPGQRALDVKAAVGLAGQVLVPRAVQMNVWQLVVDDPWKVNLP